MDTNTTNTTTFFQKVKNAAAEAKNAAAGLYKKAKETKIVKAIFTSDISADTAKDYGFAGIIANKALNFVTKFRKKLFNKMSSDDNNSKLLKVLHVITKIVCTALAVGFAGVVVVLLVKLLPSVLLFVAKALAIALIVDLIFNVLGCATGTKVK